MIPTVLLSFCAVFSIAATACSIGQVSQSSTLNPKVSLCQIMSHPNDHIGQLVSLRVRVRTFRHGLSISDDACSKYAVSLASVRNHADPLTDFERFINEHRQSGKPVFATIQGRLAKGDSEQFVLKRNFVFNLESVSEIGEGSAAKTL
jgi:hypothetical protein